MTSLKPHETIEALKMACAQLDDENTRVHSINRDWKKQNEKLEAALYSLVGQLIREGRKAEVLTHPDETIRHIAGALTCQRWINDGE